ncbi:M20 aminoacylase family protein [Martelella mediterranea]|uniref:Putative hydrolase YxeP n=1 Tax=Martelella mediterranea DSM 17316 TaxID=1122214 RepID=A0A1U9Z121_9HYPH|nr:M20 aminoacylase family protein [Martelella mediterranea]AQZ51368.1 putative hydrolase YxeP [Martelella mediterranea DSM 17316]
MPVLNYAAELQSQATEWRHHLHRHPELLYDVEATAGFIAEQLRQFGVDEVVEGIGRTGLVGVIHGRAGEGRTIGLRADMDALPINEKTGRPWASTVPGKMHACGHDGHMAMLLGAAKYLAETRNFRGRVVVIFQPAEEGGGGGKAMIEDGLMDRFSIAEVYGMHNFPGLPVGEFAIRPGPIMAATDEFRILIRGKGGHAAQPHTTIDPVVIGSQIVGALQTIVSRSADPVGALVVSVTEFHAGFAHNVIPSEAELGGTVRSFTPENRDMAEQRLKAIAEGIAAAQGGEAVVTYTRNYPATVNHEEETRHAADAAIAVAGAEAVNTAVAPWTAAEDFSYMLEARPGAFIMLGNGDSAGLHNPDYDFNDEALAHGISYWVRLAEARLAA